MRRCCMVFRWFIIVFIFSQLVYAQSGIFVGVNGGVSGISSDKEYYTNFMEIDWPDDSKNGFGGSYGINIGYDLYFHDKQAVRFYADYIGARYTNLKDVFGNINTNLISFNTDYRYDFIPSFGMFVGGNLGYFMFNSSGPYGDHSSFAVGANIGLIWQMLEFLSLEVRSKIVNVNLPNKSFDIQNSRVTRKVVEVDTPYYITVGLSFKF